MEVLGLIIGIIGLAVAFWQYMDARKAKAELANYMRRLPDQVLNNISGFLKGSQGEALEFYDLQESDKRYHTRIADMDGDGDDELLVQYPFGLHNAALRVYGIKEHEFRLIAELSVDTMAGFIVEDFDNDGRLEVKTLEVSPAADLPYACGFRDEVWFRLENGAFVEVNRIPRYTKTFLKEFKADPEKFLLNED